MICNQLFPLIELKTWLAFVTIFTFTCQEPLREAAAVCCSSGWPVREPPRVSLIIDAFNYNGLLVFLIANVLTGMVNLMSKPNNEPKTVAIATLCSYMAAVCFSAIVLHRFKIKLNFW